MKIRTLVTTLAMSALAVASVTTVTPAAADGHPSKSRHVHAVAEFQPVAGANFLTKISGQSVLSYGTVALTAQTTIDGQPYTANLSAGLEYVNGNGPFHGSLTFIAANGDSLAFDYKGAAALNADGSTTVVGSLKAFSGTGQFAHTTGVGAVLGSRAAGLPVGSPVTYVIDADVHQGPRSMPAVTACVEDFPRTTTGFTAELTGVPSERLVTTNPDGRSYGLIRLTGNSTFDGTPVSVTDLADIAYRLGSGPFNGFVTLTDPAGSMLVMRFDGGTKAKRTGGATINGPLTVIAGTGRWAGATGNGVLTGTRSGVVGSPLQAVARIALNQPTVGEPC